MENYFAYYKGYQEKNQKNVNPLVILIISIILFLTLVFGLIGIIPNLFSGKSFEEIFSLAPVVVIMTFASIILFPFSLIFFFYLRKTNIEMKSYKRVTVYIDKEELMINIKCENEQLVIKTWKKIYIPKNQIKEIIKEDKVKVIFELDKEYFILFKKEDFELLNIHL